MQRRESFAGWGHFPWYRRMPDLVTRRPDWEVTADRDWAPAIPDKPTCSQSR